MPSPMHNAVRLPLMLPCHPPVGSEVCAVFDTSQAKVSNLGLASGIKQDVAWAEKHIPMVSEGHSNVCRMVTTTESG